METIRFDEGTKNWQWAVCEIKPAVDGEERTPEFFDNVSKNGVQITVIMNGVEFKFSSLIERLMEDFDRQVQEAAVEMIKAKAADLTHRMHALDRIVMDEVTKLFPNVNFEDY